MTHEDGTRARIREYHNFPLRKINEVWFLDIFTLKNLISPYNKPVNPLHVTHLESVYKYGVKIIPRG